MSHYPKALRLTTTTISSCGLLPISLSATTFYSQSRFIYVLSPSTRRYLDVQFTSVRLLTHHYGIRDKGYLALKSVGFPELGRISGRINAHLTENYPQAYFAKLIRHILWRTWSREEHSRHNVCILVTESFIKTIHYSLKVSTIH